MPRNKLIRVTEETIKKLKAYKIVDRETYDEVIQRLLGNKNDKMD